MQYSNGLVIPGANRGLELVQKQPLGFVRDVRGYAAFCLGERESDESLGDTVTQFSILTGPSVAIGPYIHSSNSTSF